MAKINKTKNWGSAFGERSVEMGSKDGTRGVAAYRERPNNGDPARETLFFLHSAEAVDLLARTMNADATDFGDEANFQEWFLRDFANRSDVEQRI